DPKVLGRASHFALYADVNNDGHLDIFSAAKSDANKPNEDHTDRSRVLLQDEKGTFSFATGATDITPSASQLWSTTSATFLDYDRDGIIDIFVGFWYKNYGRSYEALQDRLYKGRGDGTFEDVTAKTGLTTLPFQQGYKNGTNHKPTYGVTSCDVNDDGYTDLLVSAYGRQYNMLYLNNGRGSFTELGRPSGFAGDEQRDPKDNEFYRCFCAAYPIQCPAGVPKPRIQCSNPPPWNNTLDSHPFRLNGNTFTTVCGDINRDGKNDLYNTEIRHWHIGTSSDPTQLLLNITSGSTIKFKRMAPQTVGMSRPKTGSWNQGDLMAAFLDFDNDGREDIYLCNSDYPFTYGHLFHQQTPKADGTPTFTDIAKKAGVDHARAVGVTAIDIDNDGDLDLVIGSSRARCKAAEGCPWKVNEVRVYENLVGQDTNWLKISLRGKGKGGTNKMGIGSTIWVTAGGVTQMKEISGGYGVSGQQHGLVAHFGLGKHCTIEKIMVRWANSSRGRQVFENVQANQHIQINEGVDTLTTR
ncbi:MAG TPA: hypothetical protein DCE42_27790, partial [Myxococcales bacterium]|nr:hypothetical protein [Myxococcales bacterium]